MNIRRTGQGDHTPAARAAGPAAADAIRESLAVQRQSGTVSAVEYLKSNGVGSATIRRVLSGQLGAASAGGPERLSSP